MVLSRSRIVAVHPPISGLASMQFWMLPDGLCFQNVTSIRDNCVLHVQPFQHPVVSICRRTDPDSAQMKASFVILDRAKHKLTSADGLECCFLTYYTRSARR